MPIGNFEELHYMEGWIHKISLLKGAEQHMENTMWIN